MCVANYADGFHVWLRGCSERDREARFKDKLMAEKSKKRRKFGAALPHCCEMTPRFIDDVIVRQVGGGARLLLFFFFFSSRKFLECQVH